MATRIVTELQDDIDGSDANQTVRFAIDGTEYEIDLSERNANRFRECIAEFVGHARQVSERRGRNAASSLRADMGKGRTDAGVAHGARLRRIRARPDPRLAATGLSGPSLTS